MKLLITSICEDGWTQPIVINEDMSIVDGFHRWTVADHKKVRAISGGLVPTVMLTSKSDGDKRMATIRHNRARGKHGVLEMSSIVFDMIEEGMSIKDIMSRLEMEREEVERLANQAGVLDYIDGDFTETEGVT